jgi:hypothetical protein
MNFIGWVILPGLVWFLLAAAIGFAIGEKKGGDPAAQKKNGWFWTWITFFGVPLSLLAIFFVWCVIALN